MRKEGRATEPERRSGTMYGFKIVGVALVAGILAGLAGGCGPQAADSPAQKSQAAPASKPASKPAAGLAAPLTGDRPRPADADGSRVRLGEEAPDFELTTTDGAAFRLSDQRGKVVLLNFFATWCVPCLTELPHLQKDVYDKIKNDHFTMLAIGREHDNGQVAVFRDKHHFTFPMAGDPGRTVFALYAEKSIPRTLVIGADGHVLFQVISYSDTGLQHMVALIRNKLAEKAR
jgi:peroxiredoxin